MSYVVDYSNDWKHIDGVEEATYTDPAGKIDTLVKVLRGALSRSDLQGGLIETSVGDIPWTVWMGRIINGELLPNGRLVVGTVGYTLIGILSVLPDGSQTRILTRKER